MDTQRNLAATASRLAAVARFRDALARIQRDDSLSTQEKGTMIVALHNQTLRKLEELGQLTPLVKQLLAEEKETILELLAGLHQEHGAALEELSREYQPRVRRRQPKRLRPGAAATMHHAPLTPGERFAAWWTRTVVPAFWDDTL